MNSQISPTTNDTHAHLAGISNHGNAVLDEAKSKGGMARIAQIIKTPVLNGH